jgi:hypothetical protein
MWRVPLGDCTGGVVGSMEVAGSILIWSSFSDVIFRFVFNRLAPLNLQVFA